MSILPWNTKGQTLTKNRPKQDDERGEYAPVTAHASNVKHERFLGVASVVALLLAGVGLMLAHHFFYTFLDGKSINSASEGLPKVLKDQNNANFIGTTIAHGARIVLSMAISVTTVQLFWDVLRSRSNTIEQIDALVKCGKSPFSTSAPRAANASFLVLVTSLFASAMALVVILAPGSLTVATNVQRTRPCDVFTLPPAVDSNCTSIGITLGAISLDVLASNTYVPPLLLDRDAACGEGALTCSYNVSFHGLAFNCADTTNQTDFSQLIQPMEPAPPDGAPFVIWNVSGVASRDLALDILTQDLAKSKIQATRCTAYNATYDATVTSSEGSSISSAVQVQNMTLHSTLVSEDEQPFLSTFAIAVMDNLLGLIYAGPNGFIAGASYDSIQTSQLFGTTSGGNLTFNDDIIHFHTSLMQNVSISMLSGNVYYCLSNDTATNLQTVSTMCSSTFSAYAYESSRLLATYGTALCITFVVVVFGCWLIIRNGKEERLLFSQVVRISLNEELIQVSRRLEAKTPLILKRVGGDGMLGKLVPASTKDDSDEPLLTSSSEAEKFALLDFSASKLSLWDRARKRLTTLEGQTVILLLLTLICMILHHAYYHYLDGKSPSSRLHFTDSRWLVDQTVVSGVGIALAYAAQTLLGVAISISCTQQFWQTIRFRARTISEIDALMSVQNSPFALSTIRALLASPSVSFLSFLAAAMTLISIFAPGSVKVSSNHGQSRECMVAVPRNLSSLSISSNLGSLDVMYQTPIMVALASGSYLPPINSCELSDAAGCSYKIQFVGPGFDCQDVTASSNQTAFTTPRLAGGTNWTDLFGASIQHQDEILKLELFVQTLDMENSIYSATSCEGVLRSYSVVVSHTDSSSVEVTESHIVSAVRANISQLSIFSDVYLFDVMSALQSAMVTKDNTPDDPVQNVIGSTSVMGNMLTFQLDGNITWDTNMPRALETFAQNAALGVLSGQIFAFNPDDSILLQNSTTSCTYSFPAYEYTPSILFLTDGLAILVAVLSAIWGVIAIKHNGGEESMDFSRFLRAVLNPRLFSVSDHLDGETMLKADPGANGELVPSL